MNDSCLSGPAHRLDTSSSPATIAILEPRQVGKTTLAHQLMQQRTLAVAGQGAVAPVYLDLEAPGDLAQLSEPDAFFAAHAEQLVILNEVQRMPDLFAVLRGVIDQRRRAGAVSGRFLRLSSARNAQLM